MFRLYEVERKGQLPFDDYKAILDVGADSAIEFGPGVTTLALIESGARDIVSLEHMPRWMDAAAKLRRHVPAGASWRLLPYADTMPVTVPQEVSSRYFDLAIVDSPYGGDAPHRVRHPGFEDCSRVNTLQWALDHADVVLFHDFARAGERKTLDTLGLTFEIVGERMARVWRA